MLFNQYNTNGSFLVFKNYTRNYFKNNHLNQSNRSFSNEFLFFSNFYVMLFWGKLEIPLPFTDETANSFV